MQYNLKYLRLCLVYNCEFSVNIYRSSCYIHLHPMNYRIPFSFYFYHTLPPLSFLSLCQIVFHSSVLSNFLPIFRLNVKLPLNRFATQSSFSGPHINTSPQYTILFAEQTSNSFAFYTVTPL